MTVPAGTVALDAVVTAPTVSPAMPVMSVVASAWVWPTTGGTVTPEETTRSTALPAGT
jgi:hypothetical protein